MDQAACEAMNRASQSLVLAAIWLLDRTSYDEQDLVPSPILTVVRRSDLIRQLNR